MTREVLKCLLLLYESKEWPKKGIRRPTKMAKNTKIVIFGKKKSACGKPPAEENCPFPRETLFGPKKKRLRQAASQKRPKMHTFLLEQTAKNIKIFTKWSSIQHFAMIPRRKCTEKQDLQESDRVIAPKPLK